MVVPCGFTSLRERKYPLAEWFPAEFAFDHNLTHSQLERKKPHVQPRRAPVWSFPWRLGMNLNQYGCVFVKVAACLPASFRFPFKPTPCDLALSWAQPLVWQQTFFVQPPTKEPPQPCQSPKARFPSGCPKPPPHLRYIGPTPRRTISTSPDEPPAAWPGFPSLRSPSRPSPRSRSHRHRGLGEELNVRPDSQLPSGFPRGKRGIDFCWLSLKGNPSQRKEQKGAPLGNWVLFVKVLPGDSLVDSIRRGFMSFISI